MSAGYVPPPHIIPVIIRKDPSIPAEIDDGTPIEMTCDYSHCKILYTLDGKKPEPFQKYCPAFWSSKQYRQQIFLPPGKVTIKAMAVCYHTKRTSNVITRQFLVKKSTRPNSPAHVVRRWSSMFEFSQSIESTEESKSDDMTEYSSGNGDVVTDTNNVVEEDSVVNKREIGSSGKQGKKVTFKDDTLPVCSDCGNVNRRSAKYCDECGRCVVIFCSLCSGVNPNWAKFCHQCGSQLAQNDPISS